MYERHEVLDPASSMQYLGNSGSNNSSTIWSISESFKVHSAEHISKLLRNVIQSKISMSDTFRKCLNKVNQVLFLKNFSELLVY